MIEDLFKREQQILDTAKKYLQDTQGGGQCDLTEFETLTNEYGKLLRQLRRVTKISDKTTVDLNTSKLDLLDKVHYDALTGIYNRRFMEETLKRNIKSISRFNGIISVLMMDVDNFKKYNDTYGHGMGDVCLKFVAEALKSSILRPDDYVARYGGEEFIAILPNTDKDGACVMAERILENVRALNIPHEKNDGMNRVTISIGVTTATILVHNQNIDSYISQADKALYTSKQSGRNRYTFIDFDENS